MSNDAWNGFECCKDYQAIMLHFKTLNYSVLKYNYKTTIDEIGFRNHRFRFQYEKLARLYNRYDFRIACAKEFYQEDYAHPKSLMLQENYKEAIEYRFNPENKIQADLALNDIFKRSEFFAQDGSMPKYATLVLEKRLQPETAAILLDYFDIRDTKVPQVRLITLLPKYAAFFAYDRAKMAAIVNKFLN
jgi:hypothetical protein